MTNLYKSPLIPTMWVAEHMGNWFAVPATANAWANRRPLPAQDKSRMELVNQRIHGRGLGLPN
jgi:hypothetical protein